ncbi:MAG: uroporphyrinogen-III C-methyltransferase / uroporphyrinogen-III synthase [Myxococcales bacterium]|nr:uroporphyrinogen-III C-methyltransferase / uroporphyrinogen-III synthase [Myxococcales bacterium]
MAFAVLTRDPADAQAYVSVLAPLGLEVVAMPVTKTVPPADPDALTRALASGDFAAIVVASPRAAHELARAAKSIELPGVWAVGPATKRALDIAKITAQHPADARDGAELARRMVAAVDVRGKRVLVPRAEEGRVEALEILRLAGAIVVDVIAYRTVPDDAGAARGAQLLRAGEAAICAVFAPSQVAALATIIGGLDRIESRFCAIGETTATAVRAAGVRAVAVAAVPTPEGMAQAVRSVYPPGEPT